MASSGIVTRGIGGVKPARNGKPWSASGDPVSCQSHAGSNSIEPDDRRPQIDYPCRWTYKLIGANAESLRAAAKSVCASLEHTLADSRASRAGKYRSVRLEVVVPDEVTRLAVFHSLRGHADILMVL
ncbi:MAG TPA: hypothetical protein DCX07_05170 [Phycisphaerales bacterium]|nr:hypothetical protein [Phycisphaerales bacterium]